MKGPFFSIIIPTFNASRTPGACLDSLIRQDFTDWEAIIVDGLSTDNTVELASQVSKGIPAIKILSEKDRGIYDAMNKGMEKASGKWLYFLGSDDKLYSHDTLREVALEVSKHESEFDILYGNVYSERFGGLYDGPFDFKKIRKKNISHQAIFFQKDVFAVIGSFDLKYRSQADWDHNLRWYLSSKLRHKYIDQVIAYYADGGFSSTHGDDLFFADLDFNYVKYGSNILSKVMKISILSFQFLKAIKRGEINRATKVARHIRYI